MGSNITTSQTIGPFPHEAWRWAFSPATQAASPSTTLTISGAIYDGNGEPVNDAILETWMPGAAARDRAEAMPGFRRVATGDTGEYSLLLPAPELSGRGEPAAFVTVFARGMLNHQFTAVFLEDDAGLAHSEILNQVPTQRRATLLAARQGAGRYRWDIWLQTEKETVFFDYT